MDEIIAFGSIELADLFIRHHIDDLIIFDRKFLGKPVGYMTTLCYEDKVHINNLVGRDLDFGFIQEHP